MAKAVFLDALGGIENFAVRSHDLPPPAAGELRVRHTAIGVNFIDIYQRTGLYPVNVPAILGSEAVGVVEAVGEGVEGFAPGDRVACLYGGGAYAVAGNASAAQSARLPDGVDDETAAASYLKGLTVEMLVRDVFPLGPGHTALVYAAAGGVGTLLCQWARHIGARVIGVVGAAEKKAVAEANGADAVIVRSETDAIASEVRRLTNGFGVDVVYDSVGAATFEASLDSLGLRGHMVTYGNASGPVPAVAPLDLARRGSLSLTRPSLFHYATQERLPGMAADLFSLLASGAVAPKIAGTYPLEAAGEAHQALESGATVGSILLKP